MVRDEAVDMVKERTKECRQGWWLRSKLEISTELRNVSVSAPEMWSYRQIRIRIGLHLCSSAADLWAQLGLASDGCFLDCMQVTSVGWLVVWVVQMLNSIAEETSRWEGTSI